VTVALVAAMLAFGLGGCDDGAHILYGFIDDQGQWVVAPEYTEALPPSEGLVPVEKGGAWGFVDTQGREAIEPRFDAARPFTEGLAAVASDGRWHFIDPAGKTAIAGPFADARPFAAGLAAVRVGELWGFVDHAGSSVIEPGFEALGGEPAATPLWIHVPCFEEGLCAARQGGLWGFIDRSGAWAIPARFAEVQSFHEGLAAVREAAEGEDGKVGFVNRRGEMVITPRFAGSLWFSGGRAIAALDRPREEVDRADQDVEAKLKLVLIDPAGKEIADVDWGPGSYVFAGALDVLPVLAPDYLGEGLVPAARDGRWGFMDRDGEWAIPPGFSLVLPFRRGLAPAGVSDDPRAGPLDDLRWGLIDARGGWVVEPVLSSVGPWGGALVWARHHSRWGLLDRDGAWRVEPAYADYEDWLDLPGSRMPAGDGLQRAGVYANHRWSVVDRRGRRSPSVEFEWLTPLANEARKAGALPRRFAYMQRGLWGIADDKLKPVTAALFDVQPGSIGPGKRMRVSQDGMWGCMDIKGRWVVPAQFNEIDECGPDRLRARQGRDWGTWDAASGWRALGKGDPRQESADADADRWVNLGIDASWRPTGNGYAFYRRGSIQADVPAVDEVESRYVAGPRPGKGEWLAIVRRGDRWGVVDERGKQRLPLGFEEVGRIHDGLYAVRLDGRWGIVDGRGREVFAPRFGRAMPFNRDIAIFCDGSLCGLINRAGKVVLAPTYSLIAPLSGRIAVATMTTQEGKYLSSGLIDAAGRVLAGQDYYSIDNFSDDLVKAWDARGHYHLLEKATGQPLQGLPEIAGPVSPLSEGLAAVDLRDAVGGSAAGYIDARGRLVVAPRFDAGKAGAFRDGVAVVSEGGRCGTIDRRGEVILPTRYRHCQRLDDGRVLFAEEAPLRPVAPPTAVR
jgi:hypothetical protein